MRNHVYFVAVIALGWIALAWISAGCPAVLVAQDDFRPPTVTERLRDPVYMSWVAQEDVSACLECHTGGPNLAAIAGGQAGRMTAFSRRVEMERWVGLDKHTIARRRVEPYRADQEEAELNAMIDRLLDQQARTIDALRDRGIELDTSVMLPRSIPEDWMGDSNILSRRICDKLGYDVSQESGYNQFRDNCLTCHGGYQPGDDRFTFAGKGEEQIGIDCLYCHQQGDNSQWVPLHIDAEKWRLQPPDVKAAAGMRNLVKTSLQSKLCLDCHVGNRERNMFVTHEMYAAGHPPLPSIELETFCTEMPQHWQTPAQLYQSLADDPGREPYFQTNYPGVVAPLSTAEDVYWKTRKVMLGALAVRKQTLDLVLASTAAHRWADYSLYDCASCHHELQSESRRQRRGFPAAPGRPRQHEWPDILVSVAYRLYGGPGVDGQRRVESIRRLEDELEVRFGEQPFGDPVRVQPVAQALRGELENAIAKVEAMPITAATARGVLNLLSQTPTDDLLAYDSARQVAWAIQVITSELADHGEPLPQGVVKLAQSLGDPPSTGVASQLPSGRGEFIFPAGLRDDLQRRATFNPDRLKAQLDRMRDLLSTRHRR